MWKKDRSNVNNCFQYALLLSNSQNPTDRTEAITHFHSVLNNEAYRRDALYSLALCHYTLQEYDMALSYCEELYRDEPDNNQVSKYASCALISTIEST